MTFSEIEIEVLKTWQVQSFSIYSAILNDVRFAKLETGKFWLTEQGIAIEKVKKRADDSRCARLVDVLRKIEKPEHYRSIADRHNKIYPTTPLSPSSAYQTLITNGDLFVRIDQGIFGLAEWGLEKALVEETTIAIRLKQILTEAGCKMYYKDITREHNRRFPENKSSDKTIYLTLNHKNQDMFVNFGKGIFGLVEWLQDSSTIAEMGN
jgi:hypothetical protein